MKLLHALLPEISTILLGLAFFFCGLLFMLVLSVQVDLSCQRTAAERVDCERQTSLYGIVRLGGGTVYDVLSASVAESCDSDGCTYRIELITPSGLVPVTGMYSSGWEAKQRFADEINDFLADTGASQVELRFRNLSDAGLVVLVPVLFTPIGWGVFLAAVVRAYWASRLDG